jgi:hypothetical protein
MQAMFGIDPAQISLPCTERAAQETFWLPQNLLLGELRDMEDIVEAILKIQRAWGLQL